MKGLYALLLRVTHRNASARDREAMLATFASVMQAARRRGSAAAGRTLVLECLDLLTSAARRDTLSHAATREMPAAWWTVTGVFPSVQDWRTAARRSAAHPGYSLTVVAVLALGIAVNTVVFSVADATLFRGLPYPNGARVVEIFNENTASHFWFPGLLPATLAEWKSHRDVFARVEAWNYGGFVLTGGAEPLDVGGLYVTTGLFDALGVSPALGRPFRDDDAEPGHERVAIISDGLWQRQFGRNPDLAAQPLVLNDLRYTIIGVMPPHFRFPAAPQEIWVPVTATQAGNGRLQALGLLAPGVSRSLAQQRLDVLAQGLAAARPQPGGWAVRLMPMRGLNLNDTTRRAVQVLFGAVVIVLLIACANVANLFFAQALARSRELAVRAALGASRLRLIRELLSESLLLGLCGGAIGLALAWWGVGLAVSLAPIEITRFTPNEIRVDGRMLAFTGVITIATGILFGALPAWRASRVTAGDALRGRTGQAGLSHARLRALLVASEVALSVLLLVGAALLVRSFARLEALDPGFNPHDLLALTLEIPTDRYPAAARRVYLQALQHAVEGVPGVSAVSVANGIPPQGGAIHFGHLEAEGGPARNAVDFVPDTTASGDYFATLGIPIRRGRGFAKDEAPESAVISEDFARRLWPQGDPIGKRFRLDADSAWRTVVGVAGEVHQDRQMERQTTIEMYSPLFAAVPKAPPAARSIAAGARSFVELRLIVRSERPLERIPAIKRAIWNIDASQPIEQVDLAEHLLSQSLTQDRFATALMGTFAALALLLAAAGLYAVLAQLVAQRTQEIGIRVALGADASDVARLILSRGLALTAVGIALGLAAAWAGARALASQLYEIHPHDVVSFGSVPVLLAFVALLACWLPMRRALAVDPASALRSD